MGRILAAVIGLICLSTTSANAAVAGAPPESPGPLIHEEARFTSDGLALGGVLTLPAGDGPFPAAVLIRGSGPSSRDNNWANAIADLFLARGVAVLLPDKRGSDASEGDWREADFEDRARDTLAAVDFLRGHSAIDPHQIGLAGLSQGGWVAPIAAAGREDLAFVINFVGSGGPLLEQVNWEMYHTFREAGLTGQALSEALELQVLVESHILGRIPWERYAAAREQALESGWAPVAAGFPATEDDWRWAYFRRLAGFDPAPYWREVRAPVLVFQGESDRNVDTVASTYALTRVFAETPERDATLRVLPDTGHALWDPQSPDMSRPDLHPEMIETLNNWLALRIR